MKNPRNRRHKNQADVAPAGRLRFLGVCKRLDEVNEESLEMNIVNGKYPPHRGGVRGGLK